MSKRERFIKEQVKELMKGFFDPQEEGYLHKQIEKAIRLGMENANIKEDEYSIVNDNNDVRRHDVYKNYKALVMSCWYDVSAGISKETARKICEEAIKIIKEQEDE